MRRLLRRSGRWGWYLTKQETVCDAGPKLNQPWMNVLDERCDILGVVPCRLHNAASLPDQLMMCRCPDPGAGPRVWPPHTSYVWITLIPGHITSSNNAGLTLGQRRRRWTSVNPALGHSGDSCDPACTSPWSSYQSWLWTMSSTSFTESPAKYNSAIKYLWCKCGTFTPNSSHWPNHGPMLGQCLDTSPPTQGLLCRW